MVGHDDATEYWLRTDVVASYDDMRQFPHTALSSAAIRAELAAVHEQQVAPRRS